MKSLKIYIESGSSLEYDLFKSLGHEIVHDPDKCEMICFTGGSDVSPDLYGEPVLPQTVPSRERDAKCIRLFRQTEGKYRVGICRGGQFLNVMSGGKMIQHVTKHTSSHFLWDIPSKQKHWVSSTHHQMMRPGKGGLVIATANEADYKVSHNYLWRKPVAGEQHINNILYKQENTLLDQDIEVVYYDKTKSLCFQPHPEYTSPAGTKEYFKIVMERLLKKV